jgi:hypothetical protein
VLVQEIVLSGRALKRHYGKESLIFRIKAGRLFYVKGCFTRLGCPLIVASLLKMASAQIEAGTAMSALPPKVDMCGALRMSALGHKRT